MKWMTWARFRYWKWEIHRGEIKLRLQAVGKLRDGFSIETILYRRVKWDWKEFARFPYDETLTIKQLLLEADKAIEQLMKAKK